MQTLKKPGRLAPDIAGMMRGFQRHTRDFYRSRYGAEIRTALHQATISVRRRGGREGVEVSLGDGRLGVMIRDRFAGSVELADGRCFDQLDGLLAGWMPDPWSTTRAILPRVAVGLAELGWPADQDALSVIGDWIAGGPRLDGVLLEAVADVYHRVSSSRGDELTYRLDLETAVADLDCTWRQMFGRRTGRPQVMDDRTRAMHVLDCLGFGE